MAIWLSHSHPITGERVGSRAFWAGVQQACDIRDTLLAEGKITMNDDPDEIRTAIAKRYHGIPD
jgi:hypothetical protein